MSTRLISTDLGPVRGFGDDVVAFKGIPFAAPPVGERRWAPPAPARPWSEPLDAREFGNDPMQAKSARPLRGPAFSEDCLTVNVWAPAEIPAGGAPVMIWFFGGSFSFGSSSNRDYDGESFARRGVVVVAPNSRTGIFGWLAHPALSRESERGTSGNYGLLDNIAALEWVQRNIASFGGDPKRITVFGCSSGGAALASMLTIPATRGLFNQTILESAGSFRPLCPLDEAEHWGRTIGDDIAAARRLPAEDVLKMAEKIGPAVRQLTTPRILRPIWDGSLIANDEMDAFGSGAYYAVPTIVGGNADEGGFFVDTLPIRTPDAFRDYLAGNFGEHLDEALTVYPAGNEAQVRSSLGGVFGDTQFSLGTRGLARALAAREPATYRYLFAQPVGGKLPVHGGEQVYVFGTGKDWTDDDRALSDRMQQYWVNFARTGDPNGSNLPAWPRYAQPREDYVRLDSPTAATSGWRERELDFLTSYYARTRTPAAR